MASTITAKRVARWAAALEQAPWLVDDPDRDDFVFHVEQRFGIEPPRRRATD